MGFWQDRNLDKFLDVYSDDVIFAYEGEPPNRGKSGKGNRGEGDFRKYMYYLNFSIWAAKRGHDRKHKKLKGGKETKYRKKQ